MNISSRLGNLVIILVILFLFMAWGGDYFGWMSNAACYAYLGCNAGFFGYDAIVHMLSGITEVFAFIWITRTFARLDIFNHDTFWKNVLTMVACAALAGVVWEMGECALDSIRLYWLHQNILVPNHLLQPTNDDTMGDLSFGILGAFITACFSKFIRKI
jgi:hypothetical protein